MLRLTQVGLLALGLGCATLVSAENFNGPTTLSDRTMTDLTIMGPATLSNITADNLTVNGTLTARSLTIKGKTEIKGPAICENSTLTNATISGPATFSDIKFDTLSIQGTLEGDKLVVQKSFEITGPVMVANSQLPATVVTSDMIQFKKSQVAAIKVTSSSPAISVLSLTDNSIVTGDVIFESGKGKIVMDKTSKINGKTTGATVEVK